MHVFSAKTSSVEQNTRRNVLVFCWVPLACSLGIHLGSLPWGSLWALSSQIAKATLVSWRFSFIRFLSIIFIHYSPSRSKCCWWIQGWVFRTATSNHDLELLKDHQLSRRHHHCIYFQLSAKRWAPISLSTNRRPTEGRSPRQVTRTQLTMWLTAVNVFCFEWKATVSVQYAISYGQESIHDHTSQYIMEQT